MKLATRLLEYVDAAKLTDFRSLRSVAGTSDNSLRVTLSNLVRAGRIYGPVRGIYVSKSADPLWVATALHPGYVSLSSALYLHHLVDEYPFTVFVASDVRGAVKMGGYEFRYFKAHDYRGVEDTEGGYRAASVEKAICDSIRHGDLVGYPKVEKALFDAGISAGKFLDICSGETGAFYQRLGYMLSLLPRRDKEKERLMRFCRGKAGGNAHLVGRAGGKYIAEWKIVDNVGKEVLLSWWRQ